MGVCGGAIDGDMATVLRERVVAAGAADKQKIRVVTVGEAPQNDSSAVERVRRRSGVGRVRARVINTQVELAGHSIDRHRSAILDHGAEGLGVCTNQETYPPARAIDANSRA